MSWKIRENRHHRKRYKIHINDNGREITVNHNT